MLLQNYLDRLFTAIGAVLQNQLPRNQSSNMCVLGKDNILEEQSH